MRKEVIGGTTILIGDTRAILPMLPDQSVQCCVTSPPYYGLRDFGVDGQIGLEPTTDAYIAEMVAVFREVRRVLRDYATMAFNRVEEDAPLLMGAIEDDAYDRAARQGELLE